MIIKTLIKLETIKSNGLIIPQKFIEAHSLVQAWIGILSILLSGSSSFITLENDSTVSVASAASLLLTNGIANDATKGIIIGRDATKILITNNKLITKISHGTGTNQMSYGANEYPSSFIVSGTNAYFDIQRTITNNSGATILVKEAGILCQNASAQVYLIDRTLYNKTVLNTDGVIITYRFIRSI